MKNTPMEAESVKQKLLIAVVPKNKHIFAFLVEDNSSSVTYVHTFDEAVTLLHQVDYDLIVCGIHFDDSRSLELLQSAKQIDRNRITPFVMVRVDQKSIGARFSESIHLAVRELGGMDYIDLSDSVLTFDGMQQHIAQLIKSLISDRSSINHNGADCGGQRP